MARLIHVELGGSPTTHSAVWVAYFQGPPTEEDLKDAYLSVQPSAGVEELGFYVHDVNHPIAARAGLERWFIGPYV